MPTGKIKFYNDGKGFGFISRQGGDDIFFHVNECQGFTPVMGMKVDYSEGMGKKGPAATKVSHVQESGADNSALSDNTSQAASIPIGDLLVPRASATAAKAALSQASNPALLLDRYIDAIAIDKQEHQRASLQRVIAANASTDSAAYMQTITHLEAGIAPMRLTAKSRIAIQLSRAGGLENANCCLHPIHGFPYLPGSGLKGLAHAYACHLYYCKNEATQLRDEKGVTCEGETGPWTDDQEKEDFITCIEDIFGWAPNSERNGDKDDWNPRSGRPNARPHEQQRGLVTFHDAFADVRPAPLELDVCTPHYGDYYKDGKTAPGDWLSPVPVTFLTIAAGTPFRFRITGERITDQPTPLVNAAKRLLLGGLHWLGAGAKTAAGYGWFEDEWSISEEEQAAQKANALHDIYKGLAEGEFIWQRPTEGGSTKKGHRIVFGDDGQPKPEDKIELKKPAFDPETNALIEPGQYAVVKANPDGGKPLPVRLIPKL